MNPSPRSVPRGFFTGALKHCRHSWLLLCDFSLSYTNVSNLIRTHTQIDPRRKDPDDKPPANPVRMPVIDTDNGQMDVISRLLKDRILLLGQGVDDEVANVLVAQLLYLANEDPEKDITLYINSPVRALIRM